MSKTEQENLRRAIVLSYYNKTLLDKHMISQQEYLRMESLIRTRYPVIQQTK